MIRQAKLIYNDRSSVRIPIDCEWEIVDELPRISPERYPRHDCISVSPDFWGRPVVAVHGEYTSRYFTFDAPEEAGQIASHYVSAWWGWALNINERTQRR